MSYLLFSLVALLTLLLVLWEAPSNTQQEPITQTSEVQYPSAYLINTVTTQFTESGSINYTLSTQVMNFFKVSGKQKSYEKQHITGKRQTSSNEPALTSDFLLFSQPDITMKNPAFTFFQEDSSPPWELSSSSALGSQREDTLLLKNEVTLVQRWEHRQDTQLRTSELILRPQVRYAETDKAVIITNRNSHTETTGMKVYLNDERIELLANVKSVYHVASSQPCRQPCRAVKP